jgi:DNA-binding transcriptional LysR family regulator
VEVARAAVRSTKSVTGTLVVSTSLTFGTMVVVPRLEQLAEKHPHLVIDLRLEDQLVDLVGEGVDVAVRAGTPAPDTTAVIAHRLMTMRRMLVASPHWLRKHGTPREPELLTRRPCLVQVTAAGAVVRWRLLRGEDERTIEVHGPFRSNAPIALRDLAIGGAGIAYLPDFVVAGDIAARRLKRVLPDWSSPPLDAVAIHRAELRGAPRLQAFLDAMST